jgi:hypothetical protein
VWEKLEAGIETLVAYEPDQARRQAVQKAFQVAQQYVDAAQTGQVAAGLAEAYRRADEQVLSKIRLLVFVLKKNLPAGGGQAVALARILDRWDRDHPDPYLGHHWPALDWQGFSRKGSRGRDQAPRPGPGRRLRAGQAG